VRSGDEYPLLVRCDHVRPRPSCVRWRRLFPGNHDVSALGSMTSPGHPEP